jgi:hypothetical protein
MDRNRKKYVGREFLRRLANAVDSAGTVEPVVMELARAPADVRIDVARGLLAIGTDRFESVSRKMYALNILASITRFCGLSNNEEMREQLTGIVDRPLSGGEDDILQHLGPESRPHSVDSKRLQKSALLALIAVDRAFGLHKLNEVIAQQRDSEFARELSEMRKRFLTDR